MHVYAVANPYAPLLWEENGTLALTDQMVSEVSSTYQRYQHWT